MRNAFLLSQNIKRKEQFLIICRNMKPTSFTDLAKKIGQSKPTLYNLFDYFNLSKDEKNSLLSGYIKGVIDEECLYKMAPKELASGGKFHPFDFMGVRFYIHKASGAPTNALKLKRNKLDFVSEKSAKHGDVFYFDTLDGTRKTVLKTVFMYCYHHGLNYVPSELKVELRDPYGKWYDKSNLIAVTRSKDVKEAHYNAIEKATDMIADGSSKEAMDYIKGYMKAYLDAERKKSKGFI